MNLKAKLQEDLKQAMKSADANSVGVLRMLISAFNNKTIDKKGRGQGEDLTDEEATQTLMTEAKKRRESIDVFTKGGRADLAEKEKAELEIVQRYLPKQMSKEEVEKIVSDIVSKDASKEIGPVMKAVMAELRGKADSAMVSDLVKKAISN